MSTNDCPCTSGRSYEECCEPLLIGRHPAATAEALMRARYTAYALAAIDYLHKTSAPRVRREFDAEGSKKWAESAEWLGMEILRADGGREPDDHGEVEFIARYKIEEQTFEHHECATFQRFDGEWRFVDGKVFGPDPIRREAPKVGRNDPCPCGSGRKYKKCCAGEHAPAAAPAETAAALPERAL